MMFLVPDCYSLVIGLAMLVTMHCSLIASHNILHNIIK